MAQYKLVSIRNPISGEKTTSSVSLIGENLTIPFVSDNTDYQKYLEWVAEGNTPEPADE